MDQRTARGSLKDVIEIELELHEQPHVVEPPWKHYQYLQEGQRYREEIVSRLHIVDAYRVLITNC